MISSHSGFFCFKGQKIQLFYCKVFSKTEERLFLAPSQLVVFRQKDAPFLRPASVRLHRQQRIFAKTQPLLSVRSSPAKAFSYFRSLRKQYNGRRLIQKRYFLWQDESCQEVFVAEFCLPRKWKCSVFRLGALFCGATQSFFSSVLSVAKRC